MPDVIVEPKPADLRALGGILTRSGSPNVAWENLRAFCARRLNCEWPFPTGDIAQAVKELSEWFGVMLKEHPMPKEVRLLYFGLFDLHLPMQRGSVVALHFKGYFSFDPTDADNLSNPQYSPLDIFQSVFLDFLKQIAQSRHEWAEFLEYVLLLGTASFLVRWGAKPLIAPDVSCLVGFDSGDYINVA